MAGNNTDDPILACYRRLRWLAEQYISASNSYDLVEKDTDRARALREKLDHLSDELDEAERVLCDLKGIQRRVLLWHPVEPRIRRRGSLVTLTPPPTQGDLFNANAEGIHTASRVRAGEEA